VCVCVTSGVNQVKQFSLSYCFVSPPGDCLVELLRCGCCEDPSSMFVCVIQCVLEGMCLALRTAGGGGGTSTFCG